MGEQAYVVRRVRAEEWPALRALRLEALHDPVAHLAFLESVADAEQRPDAFWQDRARAGARSTSVAQLVAEADGRLVGTVTALVTAAGERDYLGESGPALRAAVVGVYVRAEHRGRGVLDLLLAGVEDWLRGLGLTSVRLHVHEQNTGARAAYRRRGWVETGRRVELAAGTEVEMVRGL